MKKMPMLGILAVICLSISLMSAAQERTARTLTSLSAGDKNTIIDLFKSAPPKPYRLEVNGQTYGVRQLSSTEMNRIALFRRTQEQKGIIILFWDKDINAATIYLKDGSIISAATSSFGNASGNPFLTWLGKEKTVKLKNIMAKYIEDSDIIDNPEMIINPFGLK